MKQKILIIDDDTDLCRLLRNNLEREGYDICVRHDGVTGLQELQSADYQLVVLDIIFLARVSALLRRYTVFNKAGMREQRITAGRLSMEQSGRKVRKEDRLLDLTAKENLEILARLRGRHRRDTIEYALSSMNLDKEGRKLLPVFIIEAVSLLNVVLSGSRVAGFYPWTAVYLLLTGRMAQSGCPVWLGILIIFSVCGFGIGASLIRFQKEDIG